MWGCTGGKGGGRVGLDCLERRQGRDVAEFVVGMELVFCRCGFERSLITREMTLEVGCLEVKRDLKNGAVKYCPCAQVTL